MEDQLPTGQLDESFVDEQFEFAAPKYCNLLEDTYSEDE